MLRKKLRPVNERSAARLNDRYVITGAFDAEILADFRLQLRWRNILASFQEALQIGRLALNPGVGKLEQTLPRIEPDPDAENNFSN